MSFIDRFNIKKTLDELKESESAPKIEVVDQKDPREFSIIERSALDVASLVAPDSVAIEKDWCQVGDEYTRTLFIHTYPPQVSDNWLKDVLRFQHAIDVAIFIQPLPVRPFLQKMRQQAAHDEAAIRKEEEDGLIPNQRRIARLRDTAQFITAIEEDITKPFQIMVVMTLRSRTIKELDRITEELETSLNAVTTRKLTYRHKQGFETTLPLMMNEIADMQVVRQMHTQGIMAMFPFSSSDITHERGVLVGISQLTGAPIILNRFAQPPEGDIESPNTAILGASGSGKSFFAKLEMLRWLYHGKQVIVLDPSGEYRRVCEGVGGSNVTISLDSEDIINPLDFSNAVRPGHNALREKIAFMLELVQVMLKTDDGESINLDPVTRRLFANALSESYAKYGYEVESVDSQMNATKEHMPVLHEAVQMLERLANFERDPMVQQRARPLIAALGNFIDDGPLAPLFDQQTTVDVRSHFINFNYQGLASQYLPMAMHLVLEFIRTSFFTQEQQASGEHMLLYVDEAQVLMHFPATAHFLEWCARQCRKFGIGLTVMTQNVGVFVQNSDGSDNKVGQGILANCSIKILLKQQANEAEHITRAFRLTQGELSRLLGSRPGEGLIFVGEETAWFSARGLASEDEYRMLTTSLTDRVQIAAEEAALELEAGESWSEDEDNWEDPFADDGFASLPPG